MRTAIIDLGTNSVRFDVHQFGPGGKLRTLHRDKVMVRLGQGVFTHGQLDSHAIHRTIHALEGFKRVSEDLKVSRIVALGTSALREASDSESFVAKIQKATGIEIRVISGGEEARLIALGVLANERISGKTVGLIDIGGGSTEVSICKHRKPLHCESFPLGTARLQQVFLKASPPRAEDIERLRAYIREIVEPKIEKNKWPRVRELIGSSGTIRAVAKIVRKTQKEKHIKLGDLSDLVKRMSRMTTTQLLGVPGMESKRVDMILAGAILLEECMVALGAHKVTPTEFSLRDGILEEQHQLSRKHARSEIALHVPDLYDKAKRMGLWEPKLKHGVALVETLFDRLKPLHKLGRDWRYYLTAAMIMRDTGEAVSIIGHHEHSYYIVKNSHFTFVEEWEAEFVAQLCRLHENNKLELKTLPFKGEPSRRQAFMKLLGVLSLADALDSDSGFKTTIKRVKLGKKLVEISFATTSPSDIEVIRAEKRASVFEKTLKRKLAVRKV